MAVLCVAGSTFTLEFSLEDQSNAGLFKANPTLAAGDFMVSIASVNSGAFANVDNIPTVAPASGERVELIISAAETTAAGAGGLIFIRGKDAAGDEWYDTNFSVRVHAATGDAALTGDAMTLADDAITAAKIAANAITSSELADNAITAAKIADAAIDAATFATGAITAGAIAADAITSSELAASAAQEIADAVWDEAKADHTTSTSFGDLATDLDSVLDDTGTAGVVLVNDAITSAKFDESTAFPLKATDSGSTYIARTGADSDTLETLSDQLDGVCTLGTGASANTYTLVDGDGAAIADADIWATTDEAGSVVVASGTTDDNGQIIFYMDAGTTYYIWAQKAGYNFTNPDTEVAV